MVTLNDAHGDRDRSELRFLNLKLKQFESKWRWRIAMNGDLVWGSIEILHQNGRSERPIRMAELNGRSEWRIKLLLGLKSKLLK